MICLIFLDDNRDNMLAGCALKIIDIAGHVCTTGRSYGRVCLIKDYDFCVPVLRSSLPEYL